MALYAWRESVSTRETSGIISVAPRVPVDDAPCKEVKLVGDEVDLGVLPIVTHTDRDPYPYTTSFVVHSHPTTGTYNSMFPRCGVLGPREMVASFVTPTAWQILAA